MAVGQQKDYYGLLGVARDAKPDEIRTCKREKALPSKAPVDVSSMRDGVEGENAGRMVNPKKDSVVANPILVNSLKVRRRILNGLCYQFRMGGKKVNLLQNSGRHRTVQLEEVAFKMRRSLNLVEARHLHQQANCGSDNLRSAPNSVVDLFGRKTRDQSARLRGAATSRLNSSQERVFPDNCSFRALRSRLSRVGLFTIRKSSKASRQSSIASPARSHLLYRSIGISTVCPMKHSHG